MLFVAGCSVGVQIEDFKPAQGPQGVHIELRLKGKVIGGNTISGELLAVRADRILLNVIDNPDSPNAKSRVVLIPVSMVKTAEPEQMYRVKVRSKRKELDEEQVNRLRLVARFPQGLSDEMLAVLLAEMGQDQVDNWVSNLALPASEPEAEPEPEHE
ncbi:MAG: hypothetical protein IIA05_05650 [Proteobacteria bacterium]|nr:hypothetical protein [Pseudomonadota bacterium]